MALNLTTAQEPRNQEILDSNTAFSYFGYFLWALHVLGEHSVTKCMPSPSVSPAKGRLQVLT